MTSKFEPESKQCLDPTIAALTSIAISLKRIADNMEPVEITGGEVLWEFNPDAPDYEEKMVARMREAAKRGIL